MVRSEHPDELERIGRLGHRGLQTGEARAYVFPSRHAVVRRLIARMVRGSGALRLVAGAMIGGRLLVVRHGCGAVLDGVSFSGAVVVFREKRSTLPAVGT